MRREMHHQGWMDAADEGPIRLLCIPKSSVLQTRPLLISSVLRVVQCEACTSAGDVWLEPAPCTYMEAVESYRSKKVDHRGDEDPNQTKPQSPRLPSNLDIT